MSISDLINLAYTHVLDGITYVVSSNSSDQWTCVNNMSFNSFNYNNKKWEICEMDYSFSKMWNDLLVFMVGWSLGGNEHCKISFFLFLFLVHSVMKSNSLRTAELKEKEKDKRGSSELFSCDWQLKEKSQLRSLIWTFMVICFNKDKP